MNTHRAAIETSVPPSMLLVGAGPRDFCDRYLAQWITQHPLTEFQSGVVVEVVATTEAAS